MRYRYSGFGGRVRIERYRQQQAIPVKAIQTLSGTIHGARYWERLSNRLASGESGKLSLARSNFSLTLPIRQAMFARWHLSLIHI